MKEHLQWYYQYYLKVSQASNLSNADRVICLLERLITKRHFEKSAFYMC